MKDSLPAAYHSVYRRAAQPSMLGSRPTWKSLFIGINRFEASAEEVVPYSKINVRPGSLADVNMAIQSKHSGRTGAHHQGNIGLNAVAETAKAETKSREDGENSALNWKRVSLDQSCGTP